MSNGTVTHRLADFPFLFRFPASAAFQLLGSYKDRAGEAAQRFMHKDEALGRPGTNVVRKHQAAE